MDIGHGDGGSRNKQQLSKTLTKAIGECNGFSGI
jgi:hypothetical protein